MKKENRKNLVAVLIVGLIAFGMLFMSKVANAFPVGVVIVPANNYQQCVDTCLAYNGYTSDVYSFCESQCSLNQDPTVVVFGPVWVGGVWYPRGYNRHFEPRHDGPHFDPRHDGHGFHHHDYKLERGI